MIPLSKPYIGEEEVKAVQDVILSGWVMQGPKCQEFEEKFASYVGSKYACAVSSGTTALHLSLIATGVKPGNVLITVSHSFIATANSIRYCLAEPVFVDIDPDTYNMSPESLKNFLNTECVQSDNAIYYKKAKDIAKGESPLSVLDQSSKEFGRISAIQIVHQMGMPADMTSILEIADKYNLPVLEDAACAIGSELSLNELQSFKKIGNPHSDIASFSFHPRKILTTGDGGMITTNNEEYDKLFRLLRQHSMTKTALARHEQNKIAAPDFPVTGFNFRLTDIQASIGIEQLAKMPEIIEKRRFLDQCYRKYFADFNWLELPYQPHYAKSNWQSYAIKVLKNAPVTRDDLMLHLQKNNIASSHGIMNAHQYKPYSNSHFSLPESEKARDNSIILPLYQALEEEDIKKIVDLMRVL